MATQPDKGKGRMATIERFEDLQSWQKGRQIANQVYDLTVHAGFSKDFRLRDQIQDAGSNLEFIRFLKISRRSASEVQSELYLALDRKYITSEELNCAYSLATETKRLINGMIAYLRKS
jgi:four helix bundle protein